MIYSLGDFSFINDKLQRQTLEYDFNIINNIPGAWEAFRNHDEDKSFMYNTKNGIWNEISNQVYQGHSGASYGLSMRTFEYIAKYGWENFVKKYN